MTAISVKTIPKKILASIAAVALAATLTPVPTSEAYAAELAAGSVKTQAVTAQASKGKRVTMYVLTKKLGEDRQLGNDVKQERTYRTYEYGKNGLLKKQTFSPDPDDPDYMSYVTYKYKGGRLTEERYIEKFTDDINRYGLEGDEVTRVYVADYVYNKSGTKKRWFYSSLVKDSSGKVISRTEPKLVRVSKLNKKGRAIKSVDKVKGYVRYFTNFNKFGLPQTSITTKDSSVPKSEGYVRNANYDRYGRSLLYRGEKTSEDTWQYTEDKNGCLVEIRSRNYGFVLNDYEYKKVSVPKKLVPTVRWQQTLLLDDYALGDDYIL